MERPIHEVRLIFGKYSGREIHKVPSSYLKYIATEWKEGTAYEKQVVEEADKEWRWREDNNQHFEED
jgi:hypothetical protein